MFNNLSKREKLLLVVLALSLLVCVVRGLIATYYLSVYIALLFAILLCGASFLFNMKGKRKPAIASAGILLLYKILFKIIGIIRVIRLRETMQITIRFDYYSFIELLLPVLLLVFVLQQSESRDKTIWLILYAVIETANIIAFWGYSITEGRVLSSIEYIPLWVIGYLPARIKFNTIQTHNTTGYSYLDEYKKSMKSGGGKQ